MKRKFLIVLCFMIVFSFLMETSLPAVRIKDIAAIVGIRQNQLIGYGLVVGLNGSGDKDKTEFTLQTLMSMLERMGIKVDADDVKVKNVAAVLVTADFPPFVRIGSKIDVLVSSLGDAKSLQGGTLILTPLRAPDGKVYAVAQGPLSTGGFAYGGDSGGGIQVNHPTVGKIVGGALVEREVSYNFNEKNFLLLAIQNPDFTTASRLTKVINHSFRNSIASSLDPATIKIKIPAGYSGNIVELVTRIETLQVVPDTVAKVVIDERTGTIIVGENVRLSTVAVSHGNLSIIIKENKEVSQPFPFSPSPGKRGGYGDSETGSLAAPGGQTVVTPDSEVIVEEERTKLMLLPTGASINELVRALNALGVSPRDLIAIFQALKASGALQAELEII